MIKFESFLRPCKKKKEKTVHLLQSFTIHQSDRLCRFVTEGDENHNESKDTSRLKLFF